MKNGFYRIDYFKQGSRRIEDWGFGLYCFINNSIFGTDVGGLKYLGGYEYDQTKNEINAEITADVPAGQDLVILSAQDRDWKLAIKTKFQAGTPETPFLVHTQAGNLDAFIKFLHGIEISPR